MMMEAILNVRKKVLSLLMKQDELNLMEELFGIRHPMTSSAKVNPHLNQSIQDYGGKENSTPYMGFSKSLKGYGK